MKKYSNPEAEIVVIFADGIGCGSIAGSLPLPEDEFEE